MANIKKALTGDRPLIVRLLATLLLNYIVTITSGYVRDHYIR